MLAIELSIFISTFVWEFFIDFPTSVCDTCSIKLKYFCPHSYLEYTLNFCLKKLSSEHV